MVQPVKLNVFQCGILQKIASASIYLASFPTMAFFLVGIEKRKFIEVAGEAQEKGILSPKSFHGLKELIVAMDGTASFDIFIVIFLGAVICWFLMQWVANFNLSWSVILPKALEFRSAMRRLNIIDTAGEIECVRRHELSIFITSASLSSDEGEKVRARLYAFARHTLFKSDVFERYIGRRTLCLDAGEYECVVEKIKKGEAFKESATIAEQKETINGLRKLVVSQTQEIENLTKERNELSGKVRIQPAQETVRTRRLRIERRQGAAYTPVIDRLIEESSKEKKFTSTEIKAAFANEWAKRADLRKQMLHLTGSEEANISTEYFNSVKAEFIEAGRLNLGSRPKKNP